jgi:cobalt-zinc-cadmium resistance protein CzcA
MLSTGVGAEVQRPLATVVFFGMVCDTFLTMLALPVLYLLFGKGPAVAAGPPASAGQAHADLAGPGGPSLTRQPAGVPAP